MRRFFTCELSKLPTILAFRRQKHGKQDAIERLARFSTRKVGVKLLCKIAKVGDHISHEAQIHGMPPQDNGWTRDSTEFKRSFPTSSAMTNRSSSTKPLCVKVKQGVRIAKRAHVR